MKKQNAPIKRAHDSMTLYLNTFNEHNHIPEDILLNSIDVIVLKKPIIEEKNEKDI